MASEAVGHIYVRTGAESSDPRQSNDNDEKKEAHESTRASGDEEREVGLGPNVSVGQGDSDGSQKHNHGGHGNADNNSDNDDDDDDDDRPPPKWLVWTRAHRRQIRLLVHVAVAVVMTGWWIASLVLHHGDKNWVVPFLVWLAIVLRMLTLHVRVPVGKLVAGPWGWLQRTTQQSSAMDTLRERQLTHLPLAVVTVVVILVATFASRETKDNKRSNRAVSLFGLLVFLTAFWATSRDRNRINWRAVLGGTLAQYILGLFVLRTGVGFDIFNWLGTMAKTLLGFAGDGTSFLTSADVLDYGWFLISVLPAIIFFVSFVYLLYHWGWIQWLIGHFAKVFFYLLGISGAEAVVAAASPFIGQGESAVLIRGYMSTLTRAEIHQVMTSGFATIAGSVLSAYMSMGVSPLALISSCVMSIPASIALSKLRYPETGEPVTAGKADLPRHQDGIDDDDNNDEKAYNSLHAVANGSWLGIKIAGMVAASVLCILALLGLVNALLGWWGGYIEVPQLSVELIVGYVLYPVAFLLGVDHNAGDDILRVAQLIGIKIVANEFVAYANLTTDPRYANLSPRSQLIAMYAICGFGNFSAVGIQIGALSQIAPRRAGDVSKVALSALITGIVATLTSASIAGMLMVDEKVLMQSSS